MSHNGKSRDGIRLSVKQEYGKKAYLGEYRLGADQGINVRWELGLPEDCQHYVNYKSEKDVEMVVDEGFRYCASIPKFLS